MEQFLQPGNTGRPIVLADLSRKDVSFVQQATDFQLSDARNDCYSPPRENCPGSVSQEPASFHLFVSAMQRFTVQEHLIELSVGETFQVGSYLVTLLDVDGDEFCIQVDDGGSEHADEEVIHDLPLSVV